MVTVARSGPGEAEALARLHAEAFDRPWSAAELADLMAGGAVALRTDDGFILLRSVAGEAEILTLAVAPAGRRQGQGRALVAAAIAWAGPVELFLEAAADNAAALALYGQSGFQIVGRRRGYYAHPGGAVDAVVLRRGATP
jgi:ribosomal-protein-alanine N-acetyltransferase